MVEYCPADIASIPTYYRINSLRILATGIAASHWDGTWRDRRNARRGLRGFIADDSWPRDPAADIANHLDSPAYHVLG